MVDTPLPSGPWPDSPTTRSRASSARRSERRQESHREPEGPDLVVRGGLPGDPRLAGHQVLAEAEVFAKRGGAAADFLFQAVVTGSLAVGEGCAISGAAAGAVDMSLMQSNPDATPQALGNDTTRRGRRRSSNHRHVRTCSYGNSVAQHSIRPKRVLRDTRAVTPGMCHVHCLQLLS